MVTVKELQTLLDQVPGTAKVTAYEGESIGLRIEIEGRGNLWVEAGPSDESDDQAQFYADLKEIGL